MKSTTRRSVAASGVAVCALAASGLLTGCSNHWAGRADEPRLLGWTTAVNPTKREGEVNTNSGNILANAVSTDLDNKTPRSFTMLLTPEYRAPSQEWQRPDAGVARLLLEPKPRQDGAGPKAQMSGAAMAGADRTRSATEPRASVDVGVAYLWGRWPLIGTGWVSGAPSGNISDRRTRVVVWIDDQDDSQKIVHRIFFDPGEATDQQYTLTLDGRVCVGEDSSITMTRLSYVEVIEDGGCVKFKTRQPVPPDWSERIKTFWDQAPR